MKKKATIFVVIIVIVIIAIVIALQIKKKKNQDETSGGTITSGGGSGAGNVTTSSSFPLKKGSKGDNVKSLQKAINNVTPSPYMPLIVDGIFGAKTLTALQGQVGLTQVTESQYNKLISLSSNRGLLSSKTLTAAELTAIKNA